MQAGNDFFNENGVVDVYAIRDLTSIIRTEDGSFDPSGNEKYSQAEFDEYTRQDTQSSSGFCTVE